MSILRWLGLGGSSETRESTSDTETVRRISARLERLDPDVGRYLAAFAYVLARVANADLKILESEAREMEKIVTEVAALSPEEATLVVEIAKSQTRLLGGTENYVVTRQFRELSTKEQRARLLECLYAVAAADGSISTLESGEIYAIAEELGFGRPEANAYRAKYRDKLAVLQKSPKEG